MRKHLKGEPSRRRVLQSMAGAGASLSLIDETPTAKRFQAQNSEPSIPDRLLPNAERPVWIDGNVERDTHSNGEIFHFVNHNLAYLGADWITDSLGNPRWRHKFVFTGLALSTQKNTAGQFEFRPHWDTERFAVKSANSDNIGISTTYEPRHVGFLNAKRIVENMSESQKSKIQKAITSDKSGSGVAFSELENEVVEEEPLERGFPDFVDDIIGLCLGLTTRYSYIGAAISIYNVVKAIYQYTKDGDGPGEVTNGIEHNLSGIKQLSAFPIRGHWCVFDVITKPDTEGRSKPDTEGTFKVESEFTTPDYSHSIEQHYKVKPVSRPWYTDAWAFPGNECKDVLGARVNGATNQRLKAADRKHWVVPDQNSSGDLNRTLEVMEPRSPEITSKQIDTSSDTGRTDVPKGTWAEFSVNDTGPAQSSYVGDPTWIVHRSYNDRKGDRCSKQTGSTLSLTLDKVGSWIITALVSGKDGQTYTERFDVDVTTPPGDKVILPTGGPGDEVVGTNARSGLDVPVGRHEWVSTNNTAVVPASKR